MALSFGTSGIVQSLSTPARTGLRLAIAALMNFKVVGMALSACRRRVHR